ncbi:hypothetical protein BHE74_00041030 [Ensete ventricosum]|nr:hypothetical protein BHE74_00041030 [Ensete ventricosum]
MESIVGPREGLPFMRGGIHLLSLVSPVPSLRCRIRKGSAAGVIWKRCLAAFDPKSCRSVFFFRCRRPITASRM